MNKNKTWKIILIAILVALSAIFLSLKDKEEKNESANFHDAMAHEMIQIDENIPAPTISVEAIKDAKDGYNLHVITTNYKWTPENVNAPPVQGQGHAHIYVNGVKLARLYSEWFNVSSSELKEGANEITVTLNANDHREWALGEEHFSDTVIVTK